MFFKNLKYKKNITKELGINYLINRHIRVEY